MSLLEGTKMKFAFIGGFALYLMGNDRLPKDVDVAIYDHSIDQVICRLSKSELCVLNPLASFQKSLGLLK